MKKTALLFLFALAAAAAVFGCSSSDETAKDNETTDGDINENIAEETPETIEDADELDAAETIEPEPDAELEPEPEPEPEPEIELTACASQSDCFDFEMCVSPGYCVTASGKVKGTFEVGTPYEESDGKSVDGFGPGYTVGDFHGRSYYIGQSVTCIDMIEETIGFVYEIDFREEVAKDIFNSFVLYINKEKIASYVSLEFAKDTFAGKLRTINETSGSTVIEDVAYVAGGTITFDYAKTAPKERILGKFNINLSALKPQ